MLLKRAGLACGFALLLMGCGTPPPANVSGMRRIVGNELIGARGATPTDQGKIDGTVEGLRSAGVYSQTEVERHQAEKVRR